jgi:hypothetical protein
VSPLDLPLAPDSLHLSPQLPPCTIEESDYKLLDRTVDISTHAQLIRDVVHAHNGLKRDVVALDAEWDVEIR